MKLADVLAMDEASFFGFCQRWGYFYYCRDGYKAEGQTEARLQSPAEFLEHRVGNCWDMTELARVWLKNHYDEVKTFLLYYYIDDDNCPSHSISAYRGGGDYWYWFEPMFHGTKVEYLGIH